MYDGRFNVSEAYKSVDLHAQIEGASAHELIDLLFRGALEKLAQAKGCIQAANITGKGELISGAIAILVELQSCLVPQENSEISENLNALYSFLITTIVNANINDDTHGIDEAREILAHLRESWNMIPDDSRRLNELTQ